MHLSSCMLAYVVLLSCWLFQASGLDSGAGQSLQQQAPKPENLCTSATFHGDQRTVACYAGFFLIKMITELNSGQNKSAEHVRVHLVPYLGGPPALEALRSESPDDPTCLVCFTHKPTADGLLGLRKSLPADQSAAYDALRPCYHKLADRILGRLPVDERGWLLPIVGVAPYQQAVALFKSLYSSPYFDARSCRLKGTR